MLMADGGASRTNLSRPLDALANGLLPQLIARLVREQLPHLSIARETSAARLLARASLLKPLHADAEPLVQVILQCHEPLRVALARALHALPLTPTQMTVCQWLYHGQSHPEISQRMGVSTSTVVSHVRATYHKLGVRSAFELRAVLDQQMRR
jgi:DNA-binding CsgD family transcriptional regulator